MDTEAFFARLFAALDAAVARLPVGRWWFLRVGAAAVALSLLVHTPHYSLYAGRGARWYSEVFRLQTEHPLTLIDPWKYDPRTRPLDEGIASHLDKLAFRLTVPVLGRIFGTGIYSWIVFGTVAGLAFYPLLAVVADRWLKDRQTAAYLTLAFALTWTGAQFFNDYYAFGDGVAWCLLLLSVANASPWVIFAAVLAAAFTDERGLIASAGTLLYWAWETRWFRPPGPDGAASGGSGAKQWGAVLAAWAAYFGIRFYLGWAFGLATGHTGLIRPIFIYYHVTRTLPYGAVMIFKGLWLWLLLGGVALGTGRRWLAAGVYGGVFVLLWGIALVVVFDIERTLGYLLILFPLAWRAGGLSPANNLLAARLVFLLNLVLTSPWETPLHFSSYFLHQR